MNIQIPDPELRHCLEKEINGSNLIQRPIDEKSLASIRYLNCNSRKIKDLTGIEFCINLEVLYLADNPLQDLSPLLSLEQLQTLDLSMNAGMNWSAITKPLCSVVNLSLRSCGLKDDSILRYFPKAVQVSLFHNDIQHIDELYEMSSLQALDLLHNPISEEELDVFYNQTGVGIMEKRIQP